MFRELEADCEIVQIAAWCGSQSFMQYVTPTRPINPGASKVNNVTVKDGKMYHYEKEVNCLDSHLALSEFSQFVTDQGSQVALVAHNGQRFDFPR